MKGDYHVHSSFSSDSKAPMEQTIEMAISKGLERICFTDHMDLYYPKVEGGYDFIFDLEDYINKLDTLKLKYHDKIKIMTGIELGLQAHIKKELYSLSQSKSFDFIIGSTHVIDNMDPYYPDYWVDKTVNEGIKRYYETILSNCQEMAECFDVYGHIDYIIRYIPKHMKENLPQAEYSYESFADVIDEILKTIISMGKGIEINTSGFKYGLGRPHPEEAILNRYYELGGEIITIGSDAHISDHIAYDFSKAEVILKETGFKYYTVFIGRKPTYVKL
ncbi:MAG TPA: histidinol-phosphatase HisJ family protein [Clostridiales bacterium]|nr:histidinol-phosphatase HisJ family protein [Clostridiales bacterium]